MLELQRLIMGDRPRNQMFYDALKKAIVPGESIVVDVGAGTGFLSFLASKLGAKECYMIESSDVLDIARTIAERNGIMNCHCIKEHSTKAKIPLKADIVISETLGNYALEENILEALQDARRFLKKGGVMIPQRLTQYLAPVTSDRLYDDIDVWPRVGFDIDFQDARVVTLNNMYVKTVRPDEADASLIRQWDRIDFLKDQSSVRRSTLKWQISDATIFGFALWWESELIDGMKLSTDPRSKPTHWQQIFLPLLHPVKLGSGETLQLSLESDTNWDVKVNVIWDVTVWNDRGMPRGNQRMDMAVAWASRP